MTCVLPIVQLISKPILFLWTNFYGFKEPILWNYWLHFRYIQLIPEMEEKQFHSIPKCFADVV